MNTTAAASSATSVRRILLALSAGNFVIGIGAFVVLGLLSELSRDLSIEPAAAARLMTAYAIAYAIGSPLLVAGTGTIPRRTVLSCAMGLVAIGALGFALAPNVTAMELARIVMALGAGLYSPATAAVAVSLVSPERRGWALSQVFIGFTAAQGIGNPIGAWLGYTFGWRITFFIIAGLMLGMVAWQWRAVPTSTAVHPTSLADLGRILKTPHMLAGLLFTIVFVGATYTTLTFLTLILETRLGLGGTGIAIVLAIYGCMAFAAAIFSGPATDRFGASRVLIVLCALLAVLMPLVTQGPAHPILLPIIIGAWSLCSWFHFPAQQSRLVAIDPAQAQLLLALNASMLYIGISMGSVLAARMLPVPEFKGIAIAAFMQTSLAALILLAGDQIIRREKQKQR